MAIKLQRGSLHRENRKWCDDFEHCPAWCSNGSNSFALRIVLADTFTPVVLNAFPTQVRRPIKFSAPKI